MTKTNKFSLGLRAKKIQTKTEDEGDPFRFESDVPAQYVDPKLPPIAPSSGSSARASSPITNSTSPVYRDVEARRSRREKPNSILRRPNAPSEPTTPREQVYADPSTGSVSIQESSVATSIVDKSSEGSLVSTEASSSGDEEWVEEEDENELTRYTDIEHVVSFKPDAAPGTVELIWGGKMPRLARIRHDIRKRSALPKNSVVIDDEDVDDEASAAVLSIKSTRSKKSIIDEDGAASVHTAMSSRSVRSRVSRLSQRLKWNRSDVSTSSRRSWLGMFRKCNDTACGPGERERRGPQIGDTIVVVESKNAASKSKRKPSLMSFLTKKRKKENPQAGEDEYEEITLFEDLFETFTEPAYFFRCVGESAGVNDKNGCFPDSTFDCIDSMTPCRPKFGRKKRVNKRDDIVLSP